MVTVRLLDRRSVLVGWTKPDNIFEPIRQYKVYMHRCEGLEV